MPTYSDPPIIQIDIKIVQMCRKYILEGYENLPNILLAK